MRSRDSLSLRSRLARRPAPERGGGRKHQRLDHDRLGAERIVGERQFRGNDRHVAQRQDRLRRNEDRAAAYLEGVLRRADHGRANSLVGLLDARSPRLDPRQNGAGELAPEIAEVPSLATVDIFGDAAGERDYVGLALVSQRLETQQRGGFRTEGLSARGFEQAIGHALDHLCERVCPRFLPDLEGKADFAGEAPAGRLDAIHASLGVKGNDAGADVECRCLDDFAGFAHGDFRRAPADIDIHHPRGLPDRPGGRARAEVGADAGEADLVFYLEAAPDVAEEDPAACFAHAYASSFPRTRESRGFKSLGPRLRGDDGSLPFHFREFVPAEAGDTYQPGSMRFGTPFFLSVSSYSLRMYGSSIQYGMEVPPSGMSI